MATEGVMAEVPTYTLQIHMAGDIAQAKQIARQHCYAKGLCVTFTQTEFLYTGGEETGFVIGLLNYPRFPCEPEELWTRAHGLVRDLLIACNQRSALLVGSDRTEWISEKPPGAPA